jgi:hypothetical protein
VLRVTSSADLHRAERAAEDRALRFTWMPDDIVIVHSP